MRRNQNEKTNWMEYAPCKFCGQMIEIKADDSLTETEKEAMAAQKCDCEQARQNTKTARRRKRAHERLNDLTGEGCALVNAIFKPIENKEVIDCLHKAIDLVANYEIAGMTIDVQGVRLKVSNSREKINVERVESFKYNFAE